MSISEKAGLRLLLTVRKRYGIIRSTRLENAVEAWHSLLSEQFCYLTTTGRRTANPHTIEIWFAAESGGDTLYMLAGGGESADWVRNIRQDASVYVRLGEQTFGGSGRVIADSEEEHLARLLVVSKYYGREELHTTGWEAEALPVAIDLTR